MLPFQWALHQTDCGFRTGWAAASELLAVAAPQARPSAASNILHQRLNLGNLPRTGQLLLSLYCQRITAKPRFGDCSPTELPAALATVPRQAQNGLSWTWQRLVSLCIHCIFAEAHTVRLKRGAACIGQQSPLHVLGNTMVKVGLLYSLQGCFDTGW